MKSELWKPRQTRWDASVLVGQVKRADIQLTSEKLEELRDYFWFDLCAEWDSTYLHDEIHRGESPWSQEFLAFEQAWFEDEINHAEGFLALFCLLYEEDEALVRQRLRERTPDFAPLAEFLHDEWGLSLLFAYDELATMRAYHIDVALYQSLGTSELSRFIRLLLRDETYHHANAVDLVLRQEGLVFEKVSHLIDRFLAYDQQDPRYQATFVFDHEWAHVGEDFFLETAKMLKERLAKSMKKAG